MLSVLFSKYKTKAFVRDRHTDTDRHTHRHSYTQDRHTQTEQGTDSQDNLWQTQMETHTQTTNDRRNGEHKVENLDLALVK